jgi:hypothetical protein
MRFMMMVKHPELSAPPPKEFVDAMNKLNEDTVKSGGLVTGGGLASTAQSYRVRLSGGEIKVIDGPFTEAKEVVGGFAILEYKSKEDAIKGAIDFMGLHKKHWPGWEGETEVRQIWGPAQAPAPQK